MDLIKASSYYLTESETPNENSLGQVISDSETGLNGFWAWFNGSVVVDHANRPLVCYHGTEATFDEFDYKFLGKNGRALGVGFYFTDSKDVADGYGKQTKSAYLSIKKPMTMKTKNFSRAVITKIINVIAKEEAQTNPDGMPIEDGFLSNYGDIRHQGYNQVVRSAVDLMVGNETANDLIGDLVGSGVSPKLAVDAICKVTGYDGLVIDGYNNDNADFKIFVVTKPSAIKAVGNKTFNPDTPKITEDVWESTNYFVEAELEEDLGSYVRVGKSHVRYYVNPTLEKFRKIKLSDRFGDVRVGIEDCKVYAWAACECLHSDFEKSNGNAFDFKVTISDFDDFDK